MIIYISNIATSASSVDRFVSFLVIVILGSPNIEYITVNPEIASILIHGMMSNEEYKVCVIYISFY